VNVDTGEWRALSARVGDLEDAVRKVRDEQVCHGFLHDAFYPWPWRQERAPAMRARRARRLWLVPRTERETAP
jgi:hypothetical protein